jgi:hypothetical protein
LSFQAGSTKLERFLPKSCFKYGSKETKVWVSIFFSNFEYM